MTGRLLRMAGLPLRLARALVRHGPTKVLRFVGDIIGRRGLAGALAHALRPQEIAADQALVAPVPATAPVVRRRLRLSGADWSAWVRSTTPLAAGDPLDDQVAPIRLAAVIRGADPQARDVTHRSLAQLDPAALAGPVTIIEDGEGGEVEADWILFLDAGDELAPCASLLLARAMRDGEADIVTFDMTWTDADGEVTPVLAPGPNPMLATAFDPSLGRIVLNASRLGAGVGTTFDTGRWLKAWSRRAGRRARGRWRHVGRPLLALAASPEPLFEAARARLIKARRKPAPEVRAGRVSVVICTKDKGWLLAQLVDQLLRLPAVADVTIVANNTRSAHALETLARLDRDARVRVLRIDVPFNFSLLSNAGARDGQGDLVLMLNDDIAPASEDWLDRMISRIDDVDVGVVGPLLLYPDETIQHAGMFLGYREAAGHVLRHARLGEDEHLTATAPREVSCVTGAVMLIRRAAFEAVGGLDEMLPTFLQDVDLCLRLHESGWRIVFDPAAVLFHMESASIRELLSDPEQGARRRAERDWFDTRWRGWTDPYHPIALDRQDESLTRLSV